MKTMRDVTEGEELFLSYGYNPGMPTAPRWYKEQYKELIRNRPELGRALQELEKAFNKQYGIGQEKQTEEGMTVNGYNIKKSGIVKETLQL